MANYTAADIKALREKTGAGMLDVKKALDEANGDQQKAMEIARMETAAPKRERRRIVQPHALRVASTAFSPLMFHSLT